MSFTIGGPSAAERARTLVNEALTPSRIDAAIKEWNAKVGSQEPPAGPEVVNFPIDPELQTGDSRGLGGAMEIHRKKPPQP